MHLDPVTADALRAALATVVAIPVTPFGPDGSVDWDTYAKLLHRPVDSGVTVVTDSSADNVSVVKEALAQLGLCRADVRPPSRPLPGDVREQVTAILGGWGLRAAEAQP